MGYKEKYKTWCWEVKLRYDNWLRQQRRKREVRNDERRALDR